MAEKAKRGSKDRNSMSVLARDSVHAEHAQHQPLSLGEDAASEKKK